MNKEVVIVSMNDDWEGLYVDGLLVTQGHRVSIHEILEVFGLTVTQEEAEAGWSEDRADLPEELEEVELA